MEDKSITIREVAKDARVSIATVSRALNEPWRVSPETRDKVNASVEKLGYKPNLRARLLARGESGTICFLLCNRPFIHSVHAGILQGAALEADQEGVQMVYATCTYSPAVAPSDIQMPRIIAARSLVDGVIIAGTNYPNMIRAVEELGVPYVVFGTNLVSGDESVTRNAVYVDDEGGGYQATEHLLSLGHTRIKFIGDVSLPWYRRRYLGYVRAMTQSGLQCDAPIGSSFDGELAMGFKSINDLCDRADKFTAVFAGGDMAALGATRALRHRGIHIPRDVSVVGFNDEEFAQVAEPPLTTVRAPKEEIGAQCVHMLNDLIENPNPRTNPVVLPVKLVLRDSTAKARED